MKNLKKSFLALFMVVLMLFSTVMLGADLTIVKADPVSVSVTESAGWLESAYAKWAPVAGATEYRVSVKKVGGSYTQIDDMLIRQYGEYWRADAVGLSAGNYIMKIEACVNDSFIYAETGELTVKAYDRTGFAWVNTSGNGDANGAYNADGTLKSNAVVLYVTEDTKDTVTLDVVTDSKGTKTSAAGIQNIVNLYKKGYDSRPLDIRIIGQVTDFSVMEGGDFVISGSGSSKRINCGITIEGIGDDATCDGWGIRIKNASGVEVRNLGFMNCNSSEGDNVGLQQDCDHVWVHNCDMFYGDAGSDKDQVKGDGALDCKKSTYVTFSYNHFFDNGKCNLLGLSEGTTDGLYITYHHNWYDHSDSRHPRVRYYSAHVYNNYYDGNAKYGVGSTLGSSVFVEANYFRNCPFPMETSMQGSDVFAADTTRDVTNNATFSKEAGGTIKAFNNIMTGSYTFIPYGCSTYVLNGTETAYNLSGTTSDVDFDAYVVENAKDTVPSSVVSYSGSNTYNNFDTSSTMYAYTADAPADVPAIVTAYAGRVNGGDFTWEFNNAVDDASYDVNEALKAAVTNYKTSLVSIGGGDTSDPTVLKGIVVTPDSKTLSVGGTVSLVVSPSTTNAVIQGAITYESQNPSVATVNDAGLVTAVSQGTASIVATADGFSATCVVTVTEGGQGTGEISGDYLHNFTESGKTSDFYAITGNLSTSKGTATYAGLTLTQCLKMESSTSIVFTAPADGKLTLVTNNAAVTIKVNGTKYTTDSDGVAVVDVAAGEVTITKGDTANLFLMNYTPNQSEVEEPGDADDYTGLRKADDNNWYYYVDGSVDETYTGIVENDAGFWYVENGQINFNKSGVIVSDGKEYVVKYGYMSTGYYGLAKKSDGTWAYAEAGELTYAYTGLAKNEDNNTWWYLTDGVIDFTYTGIGSNDTGDYRVVNGQIDFTYNGWFNANGLWWYMKGGMVDTTKEGLVKKDDSYYYVKNGEIDFNFTGLAENAGNTYYVKYGYLDFSFSGDVVVDGVTYTVKNGIVQ